MRAKYSLFLSICAALTASRAQCVPFSQYGQITNVQNYSTSPFWSPNAPYNQRPPQPVYATGADVTTDQCQSTVSALVAAACAANNNCIGTQLSDIRPAVMVQLSRMPGHNYATACAGFIDTAYSEYVAKYANAAPTGAPTPFPNVKPGTTSNNAATFDLKNPFVPATPKWKADMVERATELKQLSAANGNGPIEITKEEFPKTAADLTLAQRMENEIAGYTPFKDLKAYHGIKIEEVEPKKKKTEPTDDLPPCVSPCPDNPAAFTPNDYLNTNSHFYNENDKWVCWEDTEPHFHIWAPDTSKLRSAKPDEATKALKFITDAKANNLCKDNLNIQSNLIDTPPLSGIPEGCYTKCSDLQLNPSEMATYGSFPDKLNTYLTEQLGESTNYCLNDEGQLCDPITIPGSFTHINNFLTDPGTADVLREQINKVKQLVESANWNEICDATPAAPAVAPTTTVSPKCLTMCDQLSSDGPTAIRQLQDCMNKEFWHEMFRTETPINPGGYACYKRDSEGYLYPYYVYAIENFVTEKNQELTIKWSQERKYTNFLIDIMNAAEKCIQENKCTLNETKLFGFH